MQLRLFCSALTAALVLCATGAPQAAARRAAAVTLGSVERVSDFGSAHVFQAFLAASPADPKRLMLCGDFENSGEMWIHAYVLLSTNGGRSWRQTLLDDSSRWMSEPACTFGTNDRAYYTVGASDVYNGQPHHETGHTHVYHSEDGGATWSKMYSRPDGWIDWPWLAVAHPKSGGETVVFFGNGTTDKLGQWTPKRPDVQEWNNASAALTAPFAIDGPSVVGAFSGGSVTLADGIALFVAPSRTAGAASWATSEGGMHVFAYDLTSHTLSNRATLRSVMGRSFGFPASMAMAARGKYKSRIYAAWTEADLDASQLWIASSDDGAFTWSAHPVVDGIGSTTAKKCASNILAEAQVAVDRNGTVGLQWIENGTDLVFAASTDGGRSFAGRTVIASLRGSEANPQQYIGWTVPWNEYGRDEAVLLGFGKPYRQMLDQKHLGLAVRLGPAHYLHQPQLVSDASGAFRAGWAQPQPDSPYVYMMRNVTVDSAAAMTPLPRSQAPYAKCRANPDIRNVLEAIPDPVAPVTADEDVTASFALVPLKSTYDTATHRVTARFALVNNTDKPLAGHFYLRVLGLHSDVGTPQTQTDRVDLAERELATKAQTGPVELRFSIADFRPLHVYEGEAVAMYLRIYRVHE